jgi:hypothetical protein
MKATLIWLITVLLVLAGMGTVSAQQTKGEILFETDFEDGQIPGRTLLSGGWEVVSVDVNGVQENVLRGTSVGVPQLWALESQDPWTDYALTMDMKFTGDGSFGVGVRYNEQTGSCPDSYTLLFFAGDSSFSLANFTNCQTVILLTRPAGNLRQDTWVNFTMSVVGNRISVEIEGEEILSANDNTHTQGVAYITLSDMTVEIDNVLVTRLAGGKTPVADPTALTDYKGTPDEAIAELQALGVVPEGGRLLFQEPVAFFEGAGNWFTPMAQSARNTDLVMAGDLTFTSDNADTYESCSLSSRIRVDNRGKGVQALDVNIFNDGTLVVLDFVSEELANQYVLPLGLDLDDSNHLLMIAIGETLTVYINGERVLDKAEVTEQGGFYGIGLSAESGRSRCEGHNVWVYVFD